MDRQKFNFFLAKQSEMAGVRVLTNCDFKKVNATGSQGFLLEMKQEGKTFELEADFVIDASGARALFAQSQGSKKCADTPLVSLSRRFSITSSSYCLSQQTQLEAVENGWWYAARLPDNKVLISLLTDVQTAKDLQLNQNKNWLALLKKSPNSRGLIQGVEAMDTRPKGHAAPSFCLDNITGEQWLAIGDAACVFDPITSGGIIKAMFDGLTAADVVSELYKNIDDHQQFKLQEYQQMVKKRYQDYLQLRLQYYRQEQRFPHSNFWRKMQS